MTISSLSRNAFISQVGRSEAPQNAASGSSRSGVSTAEAADAAVNVSNLEIKKANQALASRQLGISEDYDTGPTTLVGTRLNALA